MVYVALLEWQPGLNREQRDGALMRRAQWQYPNGLTPLSEYWPASESPAVIFAFEASSYEPIMELTLTWGDLFNIRILPATTPEEGLQIGPKIMERRQR